jgi:hypothetical protein
MPAPPRRPMGRIRGRAEPLALPSRGPPADGDPVGTLRSCVVALRGGPCGRESAVSTLCRHIPTARATYLLKPDCVRPGVPLRRRELAAIFWGEAGSSRGTCRMLAGRKQGPLTEEIVL